MGERDLAYNAGRQILVVESDYEVQTVWYLLDLTGSHPTRVGI